MPLAYPGFERNSLLLPFWAVLRQTPHRVGAHDLRMQMWRGPARGRRMTNRLQDEFSWSSSFAASTVSPRGMNLGSPGRCQEGADGICERIPPIAGAHPHSVPVRRETSIVVRIDPMVSRSGALA